MALSYEELSWHFPKVDFAGSRSAKPFPNKMRSLASYYYSNQMSEPHGLPYNSRRRRLLKFAHERETYVFILQAIWHNWKSGKLFRLPRVTVSKMYNTNLHRVPKELLGLLIAPAVIMDKLDQANEAKNIVRIMNTVSIDLPKLSNSYFYWLDSDGGLRRDIKAQNLKFKAGETFTMPICPKKRSNVRKKKKIRLS